MKKKKIVLALGLCITLSLTGCGIRKLKNNIDKIQEIVASVSSQEASETEEESDDWSDPEVTETSVEDISAEGNSEGEDATEENNISDSTEQAGEQWTYGDRLVMVFQGCFVAEDGHGGVEQLGKPELEKNDYIVSAISYGDDVIYAVNCAHYDETGCYTSVMEIRSLKTGQVITSLEDNGLTWYVEDDGITFSVARYEDGKNNYYWMRVEQDDSGSYYISDAHTDKTEAIKNFSGNVIAFYDGVKWVGSNDDYYVLVDETHMDIYNSQGNLSKSLVMDNPISYVADVDEQGILFSYTQYSEDYSSTDYRYTYMNFDTLEESVVYAYHSQDSKYFKEMSMSNGKIYYYVMDNSHFGRSRCTFYLYDTQNHSTTELYAADSIPGATDFYAQNMFVANGKRCMFAQADDKKAYWKLVNGENQIIDTGLAAVTFSVPQYGDVVYEADSVYSDAVESTVYEYYIEKFQFTTSDPGVEKINEELEKYFLSHVEYAKETADNTLKDAENDEGFFGFGAYTYEDEVSEVREIGNKYYGVDFSGYEYWGGAHGMPYVENYVFDRETGEKITLKDLYGGTESEFKEIVARYTVNDWLYGNSNGYYGWDSEEDAYTAVYEEASLDMMMRFENESLFIVYPPYDMGPYASGYIEVAIPYSEFGISIK